MSVEAVNKAVRPFGSAFGGFFNHAKSSHSHSTREMNGCAEIRSCKAVQAFKQAAGFSSVLLQWGDYIVPARFFPAAGLCMEGAVTRLKSLGRPRDAQRSYRVLMGFRLFIRK